MYPAASTIDAIQVESSSRQLDQRQIPALVEQRNGTLRRRQTPPSPFRVIPAQI